MSLTLGTRLGVYEVTAQIGEGGMGQVYRATDTGLKRQVAIKILAPSLAVDPERMARFQREAEVLASLNHPNIAIIHGLEDAEGLKALVMELVEGDDLSQRIARGAIPLTEAIPIARQIAEALEAAHEQGVIHRDLKPANIKLRPDGRVKVLDFGLAKARGASGGTSANVSQSPTIAAPGMTYEGMILGTPAYMSPEQTRGKSVDTRCDIWAFGCVLYEMLAGQPPFAGETVSDTIARTLEREPEWQALPASTPAKIRVLLRRCLEKDPQHRLQNIADARVEIDAAGVVSGGPRRKVGLPVVAGGVALALTLLEGTWWYSRRSVPPARHAEVSVVIADIENRTNDPLFDRTLEPMLRIVLESASFISAYDRAQVGTSLGVQPPERLDETAAREIAVKQGLGVVLSGSLDRQDSGYRLSVRAVQAVTGDVISSAQGTAPDKDRVLFEATTLMTAVRKALGDNTSDAAQLFARTSLSTTSLEVVRLYAAAQEAASTGKFEEARQNALKTVELDPKFGIGYMLVAVASRNLGRTEDAKKYIGEALRHLDGMTERERFSTRGMFFRLTGDYQQCVKEYSELVARYAADIVGHNQRALCLVELRRMPEAVDDMRRIVETLPKRAIFRINLALYASFAGNFQTAEREARMAKDLGSPQWGLLALAQAQLGQGRPAQAAETYRDLAKMSESSATKGAPGASEAASGLGAVAMYEGRFSDAVRILEQGAAADMASMDSDSAADKFAALAYAYISQGQEGSAVAAAQKALTSSRAVAIRFGAARTFVETGSLPMARTLMATLASELQAEPRADAKIVEADIALKAKDSQGAIKLLTEANGLLDTWIGHFDLGRAYLEAGLLPQADSEFDGCIKRRGELLANLGYGYLPPVYYYQGRAREGLKSDGLAQSYREYLRIREKAGEDPLLAEVRHRAGQK